MAPVDVQTVQISRAVDIPKPDDRTVLQSDKGMVFPERAVPGLQIHMARRPRVQLLFRVILRIYGVDGMIE